MTASKGGSCTLAAWVITLCFLAPATLAAQRHPALHTRRYHPLSIDSGNVVNAPASQHHHRTRALATETTPVPSEFVSAAATYFQVRGKRTFFAGTNIFYILLRQSVEDPLGFTDEAVAAYFEAQASYGVNLIRFFGNIDGRGKPAGYGYTDTTEKSILVSIDPITLAGTYNESNFQRFDLVLAQASLAGTYCIVTLVNGAALGNTTHPAVAGGMQWYVDQVLGNGTFGSGGSYDRFYTNPSVIQAYQGYIEAVLTRVNTVNGRRYSEDPTVFSWELANEPSGTVDITGQAIATWAATISAFIRSLDTNHMISTGEVGYDILPGQKSEQCGPCAERNPQANSLAARLDVPNPFDVFHNFINSGDSDKGVSFSLNTALPNISFGTLHVYPQAFGVNFSSSGDTDNYTWVNDYFIQPRAVTANRLGKPLIIEEFGLTPDYGVPNNVTRARAIVLNSQIQAALAANAAAIVTWQVLPLLIDPGQAYDFTWESDAGQVIQALTTYASCLNNGTCSTYQAPAVATPPAKLGQYCDVGQVPQEGCGYCNLLYQFQGGPPTQCLRDGATGPSSATCQKDYNLHMCAGSCICGPPLPPIAAAPGCGFNLSMFSQQSVPGTGCTCCDAGFAYEDSCATQLSYNTSTDFKCNEPFVKPNCMCTCGFCPVPPPPPPKGTSRATKLGAGIGVPLGILLLSLGGCLAYLGIKRSKRASASASSEKGPVQDSAMASPAASKRYRPASSPGAFPGKPNEANKFHVVDHDGHGPNSHCYECALLKLEQP